MNKKIILSILVLLSFGLTLYAQSAGQFFRQGNAAFDRKAYDSAVMLYSKAIQSDLRSPEIYFHRGNALLKLEKFDDAIVDFSMVISIDPKFAEAYYNRGMSRKLKNSPVQNCCEDFRKAMDLGFTAAGKAMDDYCR